ncbi:MAG: class I SAM-dependent methyltransferase [Cyclobacteriaceae bacterium]
MEKKDYFSRQAKEYAAFRPTYPEELYNFIFNHAKKSSCAWDCATGNGQVARYLANHFERVYATDISKAQLDNAFRAKNIFYSVTPAEQTPFTSNQFDLITVAQALHWFNLSDFYKEVMRTARSGGLIAVWGYALLSINPEIDKLFMDFYKIRIEPYWDDARKLVDNHYRGLPFPFDEIVCPAFDITVQWTSGQFAGYLNSWSAVQKCITRNGANPVDPFMEGLRSVWNPGDEKVVTFPVFLRLGRIGG